MFEDYNRKVFFDVKTAENGSFEMIIGRASDKDPDRYPQIENFFFDEKSLSKNHALLGVKKLVSSSKEEGAGGLDQFRIYVKDLDSTHGIVDLQSQEEYAKIIDLKNGERFGLIRMNKPVTDGQVRAARLKFQVSIRESDPVNGIYELCLNDVTYEDSPCATRPCTNGTCEYVLSSPSPTCCSSSELNYSEDFDYDEEDDDNYPTETLEEEADKCTYDIVIGSETECVTECKQILLSDQESVEEEDQSLFAGETEEGEDFADELDELVEDLKKQVNAGKDYFAENIAKGLPGELGFCGETVSSSSSECMPSSSKKRILEDQGEDADTNVALKRLKIEGAKYIINRNDAKIIKKKEVIIGGLVGFVLGSVGTLGLLVSLANME